MKTLKKIYLLFAVSVIALILSSCSEDPVKSIETEFDPPRFNWRTKEITGTGEGFAGIWAVDTNNIFLLHNYSKSLYHLLVNNIITHYAGEYILNEIKGISNNEIYLFGTRVIDRKLTIIKWNGAGFEYFPSEIVISGFNYLYVRGCVVNSNEIWACSQNGIVKYDGIKLTYFTYEDPRLVPMSMFYYPENKLQYIYDRYENDSLWHTGVYELQDTSFNKAFGIVGNPYLTNSFTYLDQVGGFKMGIHYYFLPESVCIKNFISNSFTDYFCYPDKISTSGRTEFGGTKGANLQNFIFLAGSNDYIFEPFSRIGILHWNGNRVSKEIGLAPNSSPYNYESLILFCMSPEIYLIFEPHSFNNGIPYLYIGSKK